MSYFSTLRLSAYTILCIIILSIAKSLHKTISTRNVYHIIGPSNIASHINIL